MKGKNWVEIRARRFYLGKQLSERLFYEREEKRFASLETFSGGKMDMSEPRGDERTLKFLGHALHRIHPILYIRR